MPLVKKPSGAYDAAFPSTTSDGTSAYTSAVILVDASGNPVNAGGATSYLTAGTNRGGTITTGGTAQQLAPANPTRSFLSGQNTSTGDLWIHETGGTASGASPSFRVPAGSTFGINTNQAISIWGATTGQSFSATEG